MTAADRLPAQRCACTACWCPTLVLRGECEPCATNEHHAYSAASRPVASAAYAHKVRRG